jgi:serine/threonine-protein kinase
MKPGPLETSVQEDALDEVLTSYLKAVEAGAAPDRDELLARYPDLAAELRTFFQDQDQVDRFASPLRPAGKAARIAAGIDSPGATHPLGSQPPAANEARWFGDYELLDVIAEGGMGVVYRARHRQLQHLVALKVLLAGRFARPSDLQRFRNEAETIAALDHPNIVRVYEIGERDEQLFLALRLLDGTLSDRLTPGGGDPRAAAALMVPVAQAVHHAHLRGILHRDLKPSNILLDAEGQPHVADFGLARRLEDDSGLTQTGAILGTPSYMAPEQTVTGRRPLTTAADVYGLGGILYALLTGGPAFQGTDVFDTLAQVRERVPESPDRRNRRVNRDLATICLKCLAKEPGRRYSSALEVADDLGRYLRKEPTHARPAGPLRRLASWVRRRPALAGVVALTGLFLAAFVTVLLAYNRQLTEAVKQASENETRARQQQRRAAENYRQARDTINKMLARLEGRGMAEIPRLKELTQNQLEDALSFYQRALEALDDPDPEVRRDTAVAYSRAAHLQQMLDRNEAARANFNRAIALLKGLPADTRDSPATRHLLIGCYCGLGGVAQNRARWEEALQAYRAGREESRRAVAELPGDANARSRLAECEHNLGTISQGTGRTGEAERHYEQAVAQRSQLCHDHPDHPGYSGALAQSLINLALIYQQTKRVTQAHEAYGRIEALLTPLIRLYPDTQDFSLSLVGAYINWGLLLAAERRFADALPILGKAVDRAEAVLAREPNYQFARMVAYNAHGARAQLQEQMGRHGEAVADWDRVVELDSKPDAWERRASRAAALARARNHVRAMAEVAALEGRPEVTDPGLYHLASVCVLAMAAVQSDASVAAADRALLTERYGSHGVELLRKLQGKGYFRNASHALQLGFDPALNALRGRNDFKKLLQPAKAPPPP